MRRAAAPTFNDRTPTAETGELCRRKALIRQPRIEPRREDERATPPRHGDHMSEMPYWARKENPGRGRGARFCSPVSGRKRRGRSSSIVPAQRGQRSSRQSPEAVSSLTSSALKQRATAVRRPDRQCQPPVQALFARCDAFHDCANRFRERFGDLAC